MTRRSLYSLFCSLLGLAVLGAGCKAPDQGVGKIGPLKRWGVLVGERVTSTPAVTSDGRVYVGTAEKYLYALTPSGRFLWKYKAKGQVFSPVVDPKTGNIAFATSGGHLVVLAQDGRELWSKQPRRNLAACAPVIDKRGILMTSGDLIAVAFHLKNGKPVIPGKDMPLVRSCLVLGPAGLLYFTDKSTIYAWDTETKQKRWSYKIGVRIAGPAFAKDGSFYITTEEGQVIAFSPKGQIKWRYKAPKRFVSKEVKKLGKYTFLRPHVSPNGDILIVRYREGLYALSPQGKLRWFQPDPDDAYRRLFSGFNGRLAFGAKGTVLVPSYDQSIYVFDADGTRRYKFQTERQIGTGPAVSPDRKTAYIGSFDRHIYALHVLGKDKTQKPLPAQRTAPPSRRPAQPKKAPTTRRTAKAAPSSRPVSRPSK